MPKRRQDLSGVGRKRSRKGSTFRNKRIRRAPRKGKRSRSVVKRYRKMKGTSSYYKKPIGPLVSPTWIPSNLFRTIDPPSFSSATTNKCSWYGLSGCSAEEIDYYFSWANGYSGTFTTAVPANHPLMIKRVSKLVTFRNAHNFDCNITVYRYRVIRRYDGEAGNFIGLNPVWIVAGQSYESGGAVLPIDDIRAVPSNPNLKNFLRLKNIKRRMLKAGDSMTVTVKSTPNFYYRRDLECVAPDTTYSQDHMFDPRYTGEYVLVKFNGSICNQDGITIGTNTDVPTAYSPYLVVATQNNSVYMVKPDRVLTYPIYQTVIGTFGTVTSAVQEVDGDMQQEFAETKS